MVTAHNSLQLANLGWGISTVYSLANLARGFPTVYSLRAALSLADLARGFSLISPHPGVIALLPSNTSHLPPPAPDPPPGGGGGV